MRAALWQDSQTKFINRVVRAHDRELFAQRDSNGVISVYRRGYRYVPVVTSEAYNLYQSIKSPQYVFSLTHNWLTNGKPIDWGSEVLILRLKEHDIWNNPRLLAKLEEDSEKVDESKKRDFMNSATDFLADQHSHIKKSWGDIRVANMDKTERRRRRYEQNQEIKNK